MKKPLSRRSAIRTITAGAALAAVANPPDGLRAGDGLARTKLKGNIHHSVCRWCYGKMSLEDLCKGAVGIGIESIDLLPVQDLPNLKKYGLACGMVTGVPGGITSGLNRIEHHDKIVEYFQTTAPVVQEHGFPNMICFSGNREGMSDDTGMDNCLKGLERIVPIAEKHNV